MRTVLSAVGALCVGLFAGFLLGRDQAIDFNFVLKCLPLLYIVVGVLIARQIRVSRAGRRTEDLFTLMEFLHRDEHRNARMAVLAENWDASLDQESAWKVCSSFDLAGLMVGKNFVDRAVFLNYWGPVIPLLAKKLEPFITNCQFDDTPGKIYWKHFKWLIDYTREVPEASLSRVITSRSTGPAA